MEENDKIPQLRDLLGTAGKKIAIVSHVNPDGDSIGTSLALRKVLASLGHEVTCIVPNRFPYFLQWMEGIGNLRVFRDEAEALGGVIREAGLIFCVDFNQPSRLEGLGEAIAANTDAKKILIDHHIAPPDIYDLAFSDPDSSSSSLLLYRIIVNAFGQNVIDREVAEALYVGMMTDTGNFSFGNLTPEVYRTIADLVGHGINPPSIHNSVYNTFSEWRMRLMGYALYKKMETIPDLGVAFISLKESELRRFKFQLGDSEGFVNLPLAIESNRVSAMFLETHNSIRVSLRSRGEVDVNLFARRYFDGGGHHNASGGKSFVTMEETIEHFRRSIREYLGEAGME